MDTYDRIKIFICDVDGVLTDSKILYGINGFSGKFFNVRDGFAFKLLKYAGIKSMILSGKKSGILKNRLKEIEVDVVIDEVKDKLKVLKEFCKKEGYRFEDICYMGDDLNDMSVLKNVGLAVAPADAVAEVKKIASVITKQNGGQGAVREIVEKIIKGRGKWEKILKNYL
ncbi:MAG: HAD-IIIA family hydrolase [Candidatus Omnitrophica bacterium]|nr:HAD-IIIA family hydrolase [Candidatus Omnitrophota bacterium]